MDQRVYTITEVLTMLRCSRATVNAMIKARVLKSPMRGRVTVASVEALLSDGRDWHAIAAAKRIPAPAARQPGTQSPIVQPRGKQKNRID